MSGAAQGFSSVSGSSSWPPVVPPLCFDACELAGRTSLADGNKTALPPATIGSFLERPRGTTPGELAAGCDFCVAGCETNGRGRRPAPHRKRERQLERADVASWREDAVRIESRFYATHETEARAGIAPHVD